MPRKLTFDFSGHRVLVTGGSQGIGLAIAESFSEAGAKVSITGTREAATDYEGDLSQFEYFQVDLSQPEERISLAESVGEISVLVNNAGLSNPNGAEFEMEGFRHTMEVDLVAPADLSFLFSESLADMQGSVINVGSLACFLAIRDGPAYTAAKAGLLGLTRALADKWAPRGVRVNLVAPGFVETRLTRGLHESERFTENLKKILPIQRWAAIEDIAPAVLFLASDGAAYITGQSIIVDGGFVLR